MSARIPSPPDPERPALLVGITGSMNLSTSDVPKLERLVLRWLRCGGKSRDPDAPQQTLGQSLVELLVPSGSPDEIRQGYRDLLEKWPPLPTTPIIVMSGLAPGADQLVTRIALEMAHANAGHLPPPFLHTGYAERGNCAGRSMCFCRHGEPYDATHHPRPFAERSASNLVDRHADRDQSLHAMLHDDVRSYVGDILLCGRVTTHGFRNSFGLSR